MVVEQIEGSWNRRGRGTAPQEKGRLFQPNWPMGQQEVSSGSKDRNMSILILPHWQTSLLAIWVSGCFIEAHAANSHPHWSVVM